MGKILAGKVSDIPSGKMIKVEADGKDILVTNVDGNYYAMDDTHAHMLAQVLLKVRWTILSLHVHGMVQLGIARQAR